MSDINKCADCGRFKPWDELQGCAGDSDDHGHYEYWFECLDCMSGNDLREFAKKKIEKIAALKSELKQKDEKLSELTHGIPIENAKTDGTVYNWHDGKSWRYVWYQLDGWTDGTFTKVSEDTFFTRQQLNMFRPKIVHPLPSQNSQTQEGS